MVSRADLNEINDLVQEMTTIEQALVNFDAGGTIVAMTVGGGPPDVMPFNPWVNVRTAYISYPPQMVAAIKSALEQRRVEIKERLGEFGITDLEAGEARE